LKSGDIWSLTSIQLILSAPLNWLLSKFLRQDRNGWLTLSVPEMCVLREGERRRGSPYALHHYHTYDIALKSNEGWALFFIGYGRGGVTGSATVSTPAPATSPESSECPEPLTPKPDDEPKSLAALLWEENKEGIRRMAERLKRNPYWR